MAAPTNAANVKKALANSEPSTHGLLANSEPSTHDWDLIRGGHYGQRSCEPHLKAEHMAAPTNAANVKKALANSEPSTHGTHSTTAARQEISQVPIRSLCT